MGQKSALIWLFWDFGGSGGAPGLDGHTGLTHPSFLAMVEGSWGSAPEVPKPRLTTAKKVGFYPAGRKNPPGTLCEGRPAHRCSVR
jgi:hypothetical protein